MDPFASPQAEESRPVGELSAAAAVNDAVASLLRNALPLIAVLIASSLIMFLSICPGLLAWIVAIPLMLWGTQAFALEAIDGSARFNTLFVGWSQLGTVVTRMWGLVILGSLAYLVTGGPAFFLISYPEISATIEGQPLDQITFSIKAALVGLLFALVAVRFTLVLPLMVERGTPLLEAITESWQRTGAHWLTLCGLVLLYQLLILPGLVLNVGVGSMSGPTKVPDPELVPMILGANLFGQVLNVVAASFYMLMSASVFRQLLGPAPEAATPAE